MANKIYPYEKNGLPVVKGYKLNTSAPLDIRTVVSRFDDAAKKEIKLYNLYVGIQIYDKELNQMWVCCKFPDNPTVESTAYDCEWKRVNLERGDQPSIDELDERMRAIESNLSHVIEKDGDNVVISWEDISEELN